MKKQTKKTKRSQDAKKGWATRKRKALERSRAARKGWKTRKKKALQKERKGLKRRRKAVCKVLYDGPNSDPPEEQFWGNIKNIEGERINAKLLRLTASEGIVKVTLKIVDADVLHQPGENELAEGEEFVEEWETELDPEGFWSVFFDNARASIPFTDGKSDSTKSMMILKIEVCFVPGQVSTD